MDVLVCSTSSNSIISTLSSAVTPRKKYIVSKLNGNDKKSKQIDEGRSCLVCGSDFVNSGHRNYYSLCTNIKAKSLLGQLVDLSLSTGKKICKRCFVLAEKIAKYKTEEFRIVGNIVTRKFHPRDCLPDNHQLLQVHHHQGMASLSTLQKAGNDYV